MPWCPKCKSEYEDHVKTCKACQVELVENLEDAINYVPLIAIPNDEVAGLLEYLEYSGFHDLQVNEIDESSEILINEEDIKEVKKYLSIYLYQRQQEITEQEKEENDEEDIVTNINAPQKNTLDEEKIKEMHSSAMAFFVIGGAMTVFGLFNVIGMIDFFDSTSIKFMLLFVGIIFDVIGYLTLKKIPFYESEMKNQKNTIDEMVLWFCNKYNLNQLYKEQDISISELDEGAKYFVIHDLIKEMLAKNYTEADDVIITAAADEILTKING